MTPLRSSVRPSVADPTSLRNSTDLRLSEFSSSDKLYVIYIYYII